MADDKLSGTASFGDVTDQVQGNTLSSRDINTSQRTIGTQPAHTGAATADELTLGPPPHVRLAQLHQDLTQHLGAQELRTLCFELGVDYDSLPAEGKEGKARELILYLERRERIPELVELCRRPRPKVVRDNVGQQRARQRNRDAMLELVQAFWVKSVLEQSLHGMAMIELGLEERAGAVEHPWDMVLQMPNRPNRTLPPGTKLVNAFDEANQALLILGEPGSGKTTMLLELARDTIARAEQDPTHPIPVVFNLSSWSDKRLSIADWLEEELNTKYNVPKRVAHFWVKNDELLLLLDGLDEVKPESREACVRALNDFRQQHTVPLAICSRIADYEALTTRLRLQTAVVLQPITLRQVDEYLASASADLAAVRSAIQCDPILQELAQSPLMLSIVALAYREMSEQDLQALETVDARRKHLFDAYVQAMFSRRQVSKPYSLKQTTWGLAWLARKMSEHGQSMFLIERMQSDWLSARSQRWLYAAVVRLIVATAVGLACALFYMAAGVTNPSFPLIFGMISGVSVIVASLLAIKLPAILAIGLTAGLTGLLASSQLGGPGGLLAGILFGCQAGLAGVSIAKINLADKPIWSWKKAIGVCAGVLGLCFVGGLALIKDPETGQALNPLEVLSGVLLLGPAVILASGWDHSKMVEITTTPNQGFRWAARNALQVGLVAVLTMSVCGVLSGISAILARGSPATLGGGLRSGLLLALFVVVPITLSVGATACIQHLVLRFILYRSGYLPWRLIQFLDYAAGRIFLRKVGGGYIFVHRLLLDYFAGLPA